MVLDIDVLRSVVKDYILASDVLPWLLAIVTIEACIDMTRSFHEEIGHPNGFLRRLAKDYKFDLRR